MLKERLIERLETEEVVEMNCFIYQPEGEKSQHNLAALILEAAGFILQFRSDNSRYVQNNAKLPLNAPTPDKKWVDYEGQILVNNNRGFDDISIEIFALARQVWEVEYGELEAKELPFYDRVDSSTETPEAWWDDLGNVSSDDVISFLDSQTAYNLNYPGG